MENSTPTEHSSLVTETAKISFNHDRSLPKKININFKSSWPQILASCIAYSMVIQVGVTMAFSAILLPQLNETDSEISINLDEASWIASLCAVSLPIGSISAGPLMDIMGRKYTCVLACLPFIVAYIMMVKATSLITIYLARFIAGVAGGLTTVAICYVCEVTVLEIRPMLLCLNSVFVSLGILLTCILSLWLKWREIALVCACITTVCLVALFFIPESPHWCATFRNDNVATKKALKWLYRNENLLQREEVRFELHDRLLSNTDDSTPSQETCHFMIYTDPAVYKPFIVLIILFILQQLSGAYVVIFYAVDIFKSTGGHFGKNADEYISLVLLGTIRFVMSIVAAAVSRRFGRRPLMMCSTLGMSVATLIAAIYLTVIRLTDSNGDPVVVICILTYVCFSALGILVIPWTLIGELLPLKVRGKLSGLMVALAYMFMFIVLKLWPRSFQLLGAQIMFFTLTAMCTLNAIFVWVYVPETLGKSFEEIENYFR